MNLLQILDKSGKLQYQPTQIDDIDEHLLQDAIEEVLNTLPPIEKYVIIQRIFLRKTLEATSNDHHVTRERVRQIEQKVLKKLRLPFRADKLKPFYYR